MNLLKFRKLAYRQNDVINNYRPTYCIACLLYCYAVNLWSQSSGEPVFMRWNK